MNIAEFSIRRKTIVLVAAALTVVGGAVSYNRLGRLEDPEFTIKDALVITAYPGATAAEVEEEVTNVIEKAVQQLGQIKRVASKSDRGLSTVTVTIKDKYDKTSLPQVWDELRRKVGDVQNQLPPGAKTSIVNDDFGDVYGIFVAVTGEGYTPAELKQYVDLLRRELLLVGDVKRIEIYGDRKETIYVEISRQKLTQLGISLDTIFGALQDKNLVSNAGRVQVGSLYIPIQPTGGFTSVESMKDLMIGETSGRLIYLGDVATITRDYEDPPKTLLRIDGKPAIGLGISTVQGGNVVTMGEAIVKRWRELESSTPHGMKVHEIAVQSTAVAESINAFVINLAEAVLIVIAVLLVFMGVRCGLLIGGVLFLTICGTFVVMDIYGIMLERISLGALIIALGMLVDNAIVVTEGMLIKIQRGEDRIQAARDVVGQQAIPLLGATGVAVMAFGAIGLSEDSTGEYCGSLFSVLLISLMLSWLTAITVTPLLCYMFLKADPNTKADADPYAGIVYQSYKRFLLLCLRMRWVAVITVVGLLAVAFMGFGHLENSFFPPSTRPQFMIDVWLPKGTHIDDTQKHLAKIEEYVRNAETSDGKKHVTSVASFVGQGGLRFLLTYAPEKLDSSYAQLLVSVDDYRAIEELTASIQQHMDANFAEGFVVGKKFLLGPGEGGKIQLRLSGTDPIKLRQLADQVKSIMRNDRDPQGRRGAMGIRANWRERVETLQPQLSEAQARRTGVSRRDLALAMQVAFEGVQAGVYREYTGEQTGVLPNETRLIPIVFRVPEADRDDVARINDAIVFSPVAQKFIPVRQVISGVDMVSEDPIIWRRNRIRTITIHCDQRQGNASTLLERTRPKIEAIKLPSDDYFMEWGGEYESSSDAQAGLAASIPGFVVIMIFIVICLFNALRPPAIIFFCVPFAMIGVTFGLLVTRQPFGFMALLGALSLSGMLIKNAIVLLDEIGVQLRGGKPAFEAVVFSGVSRMRPVLMAAVTTVMGMIPLLFDAFYLAMAVAVMFGLAFATLLTLILVPVLYTILFRIPYRKP